MRSSIPAQLPALIAGLSVAVVSCTEGASVSTGIEGRLAAREAACMTEADAQQVKDNWVNIMTNYSDELVDQAVAVDLHMYSSSTNYLVAGSCSNRPLPVGHSRLDC